MQREDRRLQPDADGQEDQGHLDRARLGHAGHALGQIGHVERPGHGVEQADADQVEGRADRAHDQVLEGGPQRPAVAAQGDQGVGRERGDLQEHEGVEGVAGDRDAHQPGLAQQIERVEQVPLLGPDLGFDALPRERQDHQVDRRDDQQHEGVGFVDPVLDAPGRLPAAEVIADHAAAHHLVEQGHRGREDRPADHHGQQPADPPVAQQQAERRADQGDDDLQRRQVARDDGRDHGSASCSRISSSSIVP